MEGNKGTINGRFVGQSGTAGFKAELADNGHSFWLCQTATKRAKIGKLGDTQTNPSGTVPLTKRHEVFSGTLLVRRAIEQVPVIAGS